MIAEKKKKYRDKSRKSRKISELLRRLACEVIVWRERLAFVRCRGVRHVQVKR